MSNIALNSLSISNYRILHRLRLERLGRVNLIVGKNNVGKSSLLEALWIYARRGDPQVIWEILGTRDERNVPVFRDASVPERVAAMRHLFHQRQDIFEVIHHTSEEQIKIGQLGAEDSDFFIGVAAPIADAVPDTTPASSKFDFPLWEEYGDVEFSLVVGMGKQVLYAYPINSEGGEQITYARPNRKRSTASSCRRKV